MPSHRKTKNGHKSRSSKDRGKDKDKEKERNGMNKYQVMGVVGEGAYGVVMKCRNKKTGDYVAMKKFKESGEKDDVVRKTILREVKVLKMMRHSNAIVRLIESFRRKGRLYLVFEYVERNLLEVIEENPDGVSASLIERYVYQLCIAITECHRFKVLHRDIKPENLLVNDRNELKLCDFGFARVVEKYGEHLTDYVATRWYRAPELLVGDDTYGPGVDMWAIACIMGELADGDPLFPGDSEIDQLFVIQKLLGPITPEHEHIFLENERFMGLQFPDMSRPDTLGSRYDRNKNITANGMDFMTKLLSMEPKDRPTAEQCLEHPMFNEARNLYTYPTAHASSNSHSHSHSTTGPSTSTHTINNPSVLSGSNNMNIANGANGHSHGHGNSMMSGNGSNGLPTRSTSIATSKQSGPTALALDLQDPSRTRSLGSVQLANTGANLYHAAGKSPPIGHKKVEGFSLNNTNSPLSPMDGSSNTFPKTTTLLPTCRPSVKEHNGHGDSHRRSVSEMGNVSSSKQVASFSSLNIGNDQYNTSSFPGIDDGFGLHHAGNRRGNAGTTRLHSPMGHKRMVSSDFSDTAQLKASAEVNKGEYYKKTQAFSFGIM